MPNNENEPTKIIYVPSLSEPNRATADEVDLREVWRCLREGKLLISGFTGACTLIAIIMVFLVLPVTYKSEAVLVPAQSPEDAASKLSGLVGSLGLPLSLPSGNSKSNSIMAFLQSRNLQERLLRKYDLLPRLYPRRWNSEQKAWKSPDPADHPTVVKAIQEKQLEDVYTVNQDTTTNLVSIAWVDRDPAFTSLMLERITKELQYYLEKEYVSDAQREREFIEQQLGKATSELEHWEQQVPSQALTLAKIMRERLASQTVYTELRKQLELAKITEAKELVRFKILDPPFVPEKKFKPLRTLIVALTLLVSTTLAAFGVLIRRFLHPQGATAPPEA